MRLVIAFIAATTLAAPAVAQTLQRSNLIVSQTAPLPGSLEEVFNFTEGFSLHDGRMCTGAYTAGARNPIITIDVQTGTITQLTDANTQVQGGTDTIEIPFSCALGDQAAAVSALFDQGARQGQFIVPVVDGAPVAAPIKVVAAGDPLPDGTTLINAEPPVTVGNYMAFRNGFGLYLYVLSTAQLRAAIAMNALFPGSTDTITSIGGPLLLQSILAATATTVNDSGVIFYDLATEQVTLGIDSPSTPQGIAEVGGQVLSAWVDFTPSFQFFIAWRDAAGTFSTLLEPGSPLSGGDTIAELLPITVVDGTDTELCVYADARVSSDPSGAIRLVRACTDMDGNIGSDVLLTAGDVVDGAIIDSWSYSAEAADGNAIVIRSQLASGQTALTYIGDAPVLDSDGDGIDDSIDNCTLVANVDQRDTDGDSFGNACDADIAPPVNDCQVNFADLGALATAFFSDPQAPNYNADADFDNDDRVNLADLTLMADAFFGPPGPGAQGVCP